LPLDIAAHRLSEVVHQWYLHRELKRMENRSTSQTKAERPFTGAAGAPGIELEISLLPSRALAALTGRGADQWVQLSRARRMYSSHVAIDPRDTAA
jgi:hypothetical protein